jgi:putative PEP-CTERM system histidine kinase
VLWGSSLAALQWVGRLETEWVAAADALRLGGWLLFLLSLVRPLASRTTFLGLAALCLAVVAGELAGAAVLVRLPTSATNWSGAVPTLAGIAGAILALLLLEQVYRSCREQGRWALKYLFLGLGTLFAFDLFLYADALLMQLPDPNLWSARGYVNALVAPLIAVSAARNPEWSLDVYVSRRFVLHTASLMGAGLFLLVMAVAGYSIRFYGGAWGGPVQTVFLVSAMLLVLILAFSGQIRARARVFLSKHFFNYRYDYREEWLRFTRTLTAEEGDIPLKQRVIQAVGQVVESPGGQLWQRREGQMVPTAHWNMPAPVGAAEASDGDLIRFLGEREWIISVDEWQRDPGRYDGLAMPEWMERLSRPWLVVPLLHRDRLVGFVVLARSRAGGLTLNWEDFDLLKTLGRQAASYLAQEEAAEALSRAQQFETFNRLSAFVLHDLKNVIGQLSMLAKNARKHGTSPEFMSDAVTTIEHSVGRMNHLMAQLRGGLQSNRVTEVDLGKVVQEAVAAQAGESPVPELELPPERLQLEADRGRLAAVIGHVIKNAQDATDDDGSVRVILAREGDQALVDVLDSGCGMSEEFVRERLFRPFDSSKGMTGMGIGAFEARELARELGGDVEVNSQTGEGTRFRLRLPAKPVAAEAAPQLREVGN